MENEDQKKILKSIVLTNREDLPGRFGRPPSGFKNDYYGCYYKPAKNISGTIDFIKSGSLCIHENEQSCIVQYPFSDEIKDFLSKSNGKHVDMKMDHNENGDNRLSIQVEGETHFEQISSKNTIPSPLYSIRKLNHPVIDDKFQGVLVGFINKGHGLEMRIGENKRPFLFVSDDKLYDEDINPMLPKMIGKSINVKTSSDGSVSIDHMVINNYVMTERSDLPTRESFIEDFTVSSRNIPTKEISGYLEGFLSRGNTLKMKDENGSDFLLTINDPIFKGASHSNSIREGFGKSTLDNFVGRKMDVKVENDEVNFKIQDGPLLKFKVNPSIPAYDLFEEKNLKYGDKPIIGNFVSLQENGKAIELMTKDGPMLLRSENMGLPDNQHLDKLRGNEVNLFVGFDNTLQMKSTSEKEEVLLIDNEEAAMHDKNADYSYNGMTR